MKRPSIGTDETWREEFAFDLTPNVDAGASSRMHRHRTQGARHDERGDEPEHQPTDVEQGPTVRGKDFRVN